MQNFPGTCGPAELRAVKRVALSRVTLSRVLNGRAAISPEMALRIEAWLGEARLWLAEQSAYDMWQATQRFKVTPMHVQPAPPMKADDTLHA